MNVWAGSFNELKLGKRGWLSILRNISSFSSKVTYNILHPNMAFLLEFALDQKRWNEIDLFKDILKLEPFKISKNWESYELLKLAKNHEMTYNLFYP